MSRSTTAGVRGAASRRARRRWRRRLSPWLRRLGSGARWVWRELRAAPRAVQVAAGIATVIVLFFTLNGLYQVVRKPAELFFPVAGTLHKTPAATWRSYEPLFRAHSTPVMTPELLAALA